MFAGAKVQQLGQVLWLVTSAIEEDPDERREAGDDEDATQDAAEDEGAHGEDDEPGAKQVEKAKAQGGHDAGHG
jgi:hypothetical protein